VNKEKKNPLNNYIKFGALQNKVGFLIYVVLLKKNCKKDDLII
jgi:hypothetical protein